MAKITLCGSTRFKDLFNEWNRALTMQGNVVYSVAFFGHADGEELTMKDKAKLDAIHYLKIMNSDKIFVLNKDYYIGESTQREIELAKLLGKEVEYLNPVPQRLELGDRV